MKKSSCNHKRQIWTFAKVLLVLFLSFLVLYGFEVGIMASHRVRGTVHHYASDNPFLLDRPAVVAHRIGGGDAPEESLLALQKCLEGDDRPDIIELDLQLTKDGQLILLHDDTLDRTTDSAQLFGKRNLTPRELTLEELKRLNIGVSFTDDKGNQPYRDLHGDEVPEALRIVTLKEILEIAEDYPGLKFIIEIKNGGEEGKRALDQLHSFLVANDLLERTIFGTFHNEISFYCRDTYPEINRSASKRECVEFFLSMLLGRKDYDPSFSVLQIFYGKKYFKYGVNLAYPRFLNYAHSRGIAVQYWTVNEKEDILYLKEVGADAIITDYVEMTKNLLSLD